MVTRPKDSTCGDDDDDDDSLPVEDREGEILSQKRFFCQKNHMKPVACRSSTRLGTVRTQVTWRVVSGKLALSGLQKQIIRPGSTC